MRDTSVAREVLRIATLPVEAQELWDNMVQVESAKDHTNIITQMDALNPWIIRRGAAHITPTGFTVGENIGALRSIGLSFMGFDWARIHGIARVLMTESSSVRAKFNVRADDICDLYWNEPTHWSTWTGGEFRDEKLEKESVLKHWLEFSCGYNGFIFCVYGGEYFLKYFKKEK